MRIRAITPIHVDPDEVARRQDRYDRLAPAPLTVELVDVGDDAPTSLETEADIRASDDVVARRVQDLRPAACDVVVPDCVLDPGIGARSPAAADRGGAGSGVGDAGGSGPGVANGGGSGHGPGRGRGGDGRGGPPVVGVLRLAAGHLDALGRPFASITRNEAIGAELERRLAEYGLDDRFLGNLVMDLDFAAVTDHERWTTAASAALGELARAGATAVINGCSAVDAEPDRAGPALVDPVALALRLLATGVEVGADARRIEGVA